MTNFLGNMHAPGGTAEAAGRDSTYIVSYGVPAFLRRARSKKPKEAYLFTRSFKTRDYSEMPPLCVLRGRGKREI